MLPRHALRRGGQSAGPLRPRRAPAGGGDPANSHLEGTAPYLSPAVARGEAEDTRCDIHAFGALLYELLAGRPPYLGRTPQIILDQVLKGPPTPLREAYPRASLPLAAVAEGCTSLASVKVPGSVADLGVRTFKSCTSLATIEIADGVRNISGDWWAGGAFWGCSNLTSVAIPDSVTSIGYSVFNGCTNLTRVYFKGDAPAGAGVVRIVEGVSEKATVCYRPGTKGWGETFGGRPTAVWQED